MTRRDGRLVPSRSLWQGHPIPHPPIGSLDLAGTLLVTRCRCAQAPFNVPPPVEGALLELPTEHAVWTPYVADVPREAPPSSIFRPPKGRALTSGWARRSCVAVDRGCLCVPWRRPSGVRPRLVSRNGPMKRSCIGGLLAGAGSFSRHGSRAAPSLASYIVDTRAPTKPLRLAYLFAARGARRGETPGFAPSKKALGAAPPPAYTLRGPLCWRSAPPRRVDVSRAVLRRPPPPAYAHLARLQPVELLRATRCPLATRALGARRSLPLAPQRLRFA
jgi:hypothetical protein